MSNRFKELQEETKGVREGLSKTGGALSKGVTLPILGVGAYSIKVGADFETEFAGVRKTVEATAEEYDNLKNSILDISRTTPVAATEMANLVATGGQLGVQNKILSVLQRPCPTLAWLPIYRQTRERRCPRSLPISCRWIKATLIGLQAPLSHWVIILPATESDIAQMAMRLAGAGKQVKMSEANVLSFSAALTSVGIEAEAGGSSFSKLMLGIQKEVKTGGKSLQTFAKTAGMSVAQFKTLFEKDATSAIVSFLEGIGKSDDAILILQKLGMEEVRLRDAILRASGAGDLFRQRAGIVRHVETTRDNADDVTVKGYTLDGLTKLRVTVPQVDGEGHYLEFDRIQGNAETVIKHYLENNITAPLDPERKLQGVFLMPDLHRGKYMPWQTRFEELDAVLENICVYADVGYFATIDFDNGRIIFDILEGTDRSENQDVRSPVVFSAKRSNITKITYTESYLSAKSAAYLGGAGEHEEQLILSVGDASGFDRAEMWATNSTDDPDELLEFGNAQLAERLPSIALKGETLNKNAVYGKDWFLGDIITVTDGRHTLDSRVTEVTETYEPDHYSITPVFGKDLPTLKQILRL